MRSKEGEKVDIFYYKPKGSMFSSLQRGTGKL